ncbi:MAG: hypothetical protein CMH16_02195 [Methylobacterium sp.]|nr:hypothetical protein [Methylobacterium sp.]
MEIPYRQLLAGIRPRTQCGGLRSARLRLGAMPPLQLGRERISPVYDGPDIEQALIAAVLSLKRRESLQNEPLCRA